jgi:hypothetical protein
MTDATARFIASGKQTSFRIPYITLEYPTAGIFPRLGELSERSKARYMAACIRHAWDQHMTYDVGSTLPADVLARVDAILDGAPCSTAELRTQLEAFQHIHDLVVSDANASVPGAVIAASLTYVIGALTSWLYHALVALARAPELTWSDYSTATRQWLPLWVVLTGAATTAPDERAWQIQALSGFVDRAATSIDPTDPAWMQRQMKMGTAYLTLCLSPWDVKRSLVESEPDVVDPLRRNFAKLVMRRAASKSGKNTEDNPLWSMLEANDVLLDWCHACMADADQLGRPTKRALDTVFSNPELRAMIERVGAQTS